MRCWLQNRMLNHPLTTAQIENLLLKTLVGRLALISPEGYPYVVPMHFVYLDEKIYCHGLPRGQKIDYLNQNPNIGFEIDEMTGLLTEGVVVPCDVNTEYQSVIILGKASFIQDIDRKEAVLTKIVEKYTPYLVEADLPEKMIRVTAVIEITIEKCTGKFYQ